jgi:hypothetical protein
VCLRAEEGGRGNPPTALVTVVTVVTTFTCGIPRQKTDQSVDSSSEAITPQDILPTQKLLTARQLAPFANIRGQILVNAPCLLRYLYTSYFFLGFS